MKNFTIFLIAFLVLAAVVPADAQRREREAQKQQTTEQQKPTQPTSTQKQNPSDSSGRREKRQAPKVPLVPCTLTLNETPSLRGFSFGQTFSQIKGRFAGTQIAVTGKNMPISNQKPFLQQYVLYSNNAVLGNGTSPIEEAANSRYGSKSTDGSSMISLSDLAAGVDRRNKSNDTFKDIKEVNLYFYGADDNPILYGYSISYLDTLAFDSTKAVKELFSKNYSIPVDSWTPHSEDRNKYNDWNAYCKGWRAFLATGVDNTGLFFFAVNTDIENNADAMRKGDAQKKTETFKP